ncbi:hypothetical protein JZU56_04575 [bacterium]|nr:hypothetical protein [bacterium]
MHVTMDSSDPPAVASYSLMGVLWLFMSNIDFGVIIVVVGSWLFEVFAAIVCRNLQHNPVYMPDHEMLQHAWVPGPIMLADISLLVLRILIIFFICIPLAKLHNDFFFVGASVGLFVGAHSALAILVRFRGVNGLRMLIITGKEALAYGVLTYMLILYYKR